MEADEYEFDYEADDGGGVESPDRSPRGPRSDERADCGNGEDPETPLALDDGVDVSSEEKNEQQETDPRHQTDTDPQPARPLESAAPPNGRGRLRGRAPPGKDAAKIQHLTKQLLHYKRMNAELHHQLQKFYQNEAIAFLENKAQEKQRQIDTLVLENRSLINQQRALSKQVDELQEDMEAFPKKRQVLREELRICREQLRQSKDKQRGAEERSNKLHQQVVDLASRNKVLTEKLRNLETSQEASIPASAQSSHLTTSESEAIIANQEDEITKLLHRVDVLKKTIKLDKSRQEKTQKMCEDELECTRSQLQDFQQQLFSKEKTIRGQYLQIKQLKRSLRDALSEMHANQQLHSRIGGQFSNTAGDFSKHASLPIPIDLGAHNILAQLGLLHLMKSPDKASSVHLVGATGKRIPTFHDTAPGDRNQLFPLPPSNQMEKKQASAPRNGRLYGNPMIVSAPTSDTPDDQHEGFQMYKISDEYHEGEEDEGPYRDDQYER